MIAKTLRVQKYSVGDRVIFRACKRSTHPGLRARHVRPEPLGEGYQYEVDKFWTVSEIRGGQLVLLTRRGKIRVVDIADPSLHGATWLERMLYRDRFPSPAIFARPTCE
ncbi:MAG TPA: hypothetical protein VG326_11300 [Tepidisphaeraceae bacterium]|jgi:hypothetical protein|nr:hypothetical protein [Tepidisphaeraceae bacterium]